MIDELPSDIITQLLELLLSGSIRDFLSLTATCSRMHKLGCLLAADPLVPRRIHHIACDFSWRSQLLAEAKACANKPASLAKVDTSSYFTPTQGDAEDARVLVSDGSQLALYDQDMELLRGWVPPHTHHLYSPRTNSMHQVAVHPATISSSLPSYSACSLLLFQPLKPLPLHSAPILNAELPPQPFSRPKLPLPPCFPTSKPALPAPLHPKTSSIANEGRELARDATGAAVAAAKQGRQSPRGKVGGSQGDPGWQSPRNGGGGAGKGRGREGQQGVFGRGIDFGGSVVAVPRPPPPPPPPPPTAASAVAAAKSLRKRSEQGKEAGPELAQEDVAFQMLTRIPCLPSTTYLDISHHISLSDTDLAVVLGKCARGLKHLALAGTQAGQCTLLQLGAKGRHNVQALDLSSLSAIGTHNPLPPQYLHTPAPAVRTSRCPAPHPHRPAHMPSIMNGSIGSPAPGREKSGACPRDATPRSCSAARDPPAQLPPWACSSSGIGCSQRGAHVRAHTERNGSSGVRDGERVTSVTERARACSSSPVRGSRAVAEQHQQQLQGSYRGVSSVDLVSGHLGLWGLRHRHPSLLAAEIETHRRPASISNDAGKTSGAAVDGGVAEAHAGTDGAERAAAAAANDDDDDDNDDDDDDGDCNSDEEAGGEQESGRNRADAPAAAKAASRVPSSLRPAPNPPQTQTSPVPSSWQLLLGGNGRDEQQKGQQMGSPDCSSWSGGEHAVFVRLLRCTLERLPGLQDLRLCSNHLWGLFDPLPFSPKRKPRLRGQGDDPADLGQHQQLEQSPPESPLLCSLANLRVLHLAGSTGVRAQCLALILLHCPHLVDLDVHQCIDLNAVTSGTSLAELLRPHAPSLPSLRRLRGGWGLCAASLKLLLCHPGRAYALMSLDLGLGAGVSDAFLGQLAAACTNLQEIRLTLAAVTDQGIHDLLSGCRKLHALVLMHCLGPFTPALLPCSPPTLHQQQLQGCAPNSCHRWTLSNLQLIGGRCTLLSSHIIQLIGTRPDTLHTLALSNCPYITPALLGFLASRHKDSLQHVRLEQCGSYSWGQPCHGVAQGPGPPKPASMGQEGGLANNTEPLGRGRCTSCGGYHAECRGCSTNTDSPSNIRPHNEDPYDQKPGPANPANPYDQEPSPAMPTSRVPTCLLRDDAQTDSAAVPNPAPSSHPAHHLAPQQNSPPPASRLSASVWPICEASITQLAIACTHLCSLHLRHCCQLSAGIAEELTRTCPQLSSVLLDRCDLRDGGVRCPQSSFHPLHRIMVARCQLIERSLIPQPLFTPATQKSSAQTGAKESPGLASSPGGTTREATIGHHRVDASVMVHDLRAGGTAVLHAC